MAGPAPGEVRQPHQSEHLHGAPVALGAGQALHLQAEGDVVADPPPGEQGVLLEYHATLRRRSFHAPAVDPHAAGAWPQVAGQGAEQGRLAASRRPEQADELARPRLQVQIADRLEGFAPLPQADAQVADLDAPQAVAGRRHRTLPPAAYQGVSDAPTRFTNPLLPMPKRPMSSMPTTTSS